MEDVTFTATLSLPSGVGDHMKSLPTEHEKAEYFLKKTVKKALDIDDTEEFENLLTVMQKCEYGHVRKLATKIKSDLDDKQVMKSSLHTIQDKNSAREKFGEFGEFYQIAKLYSPNNYEIVTFTST